MLHQARTAFYRELELCDLSGQIAKWSRYLNLTDTNVVRHRPDPMPENDHKFPLRDPADPLRRAHPRYAGPDGKCDRKVQIRDIRLGSGFRTYFRELIRADGRLRVESRSSQALIERLEEDARRELNRLICEMPRPAHCHTRVLQKEDVACHVCNQWGCCVGCMCKVCVREFP
jgi:hypothetical protein